LEDCGKLVLLCFPSMQDSHGGIGSLKIGRPLTMEFFFEELDSEMVDVQILYAKPLFHSGLMHSVHMVDSDLQF
jgi:hypothetical protein